MKLSEKVCKAPWCDLSCTLGWWGGEVQSDCGQETRTAWSSLEEAVREVGSGVFLLSPELQASS